MTINKLNGTVCITQRVDEYIDRKESRDAIDQNLIRFTIHAGFLPIVVPNSFVTIAEDTTDVDCSLLEYWLDAFNPDGFILSGGNNIGDSPQRDETEKSILRWAETRFKPVLGICRGMQMMGVLAGTGLKSVKGHVCCRHQITGIINKEVNSFHDYALAKCPQGFSVISKCADGVIEAIRHNKIPWEGWMWHPEREQKFDNNDIERLRNLFL